MALRGTTKRRSQDQEDRVAALYQGRRSASSGASDTDSGDVATVQELIECKTTGGPGEKPTRSPKFINELGKVVEEARERGRIGALTLQYYLPDHYLANRDGWVEVTVRPTTDDVARTAQIKELEIDFQIAQDQILDLEGRLRDVDVAV